MPAPHLRTEAGSSHESGSRISQNPSKEERVLEITPHVRPSIQVLIADRDAMSSDLLANAVTKDRNREAAPVLSAHLLTELGMRRVDVVVIGADQRVRSGDGFDLASVVARKYPKTMIVMILNASTPESVIHAFRSGARGVFARHQPMSELLSCINHVWNGHIWAGRAETDLLLEAFKSIPSPRILSDSPSLTARELQVVQCAATGKTNKAIAIQLGLSEHTVKNYMFKAFDKLGVTSRIELLFILTVRGTLPSYSTPDDPGDEIEDAVIAL